jgi:hypothetical protein
MVTTYCDSCGTEGTKAKLSMSWTDGRAAGFLRSDNKVFDLCETCTVRVMTDAAKELLRYTATAEIVTPPVNAWEHADPAPEPGLWDRLVASWKAAIHG